MTMSPNLMTIVTINGLEIYIEEIAIVVDIPLNLVRTFLRWGKLALLGMLEKSDYENRLD
jgi:hypothetical protein